MNKPSKYKVPTREEFKEHKKSNPGEYGWKAQRKAIKRQLTRVRKTFGE